MFKAKETVFEEGRIMRPLKKTILTGTILFILVLCIVLSSVQYNSSKAMLYDQYQSYMSGILHFVAKDIDVDDLEKCISTGVESAKYHELQTELDKTKERLDIHFLYIVVPLNTEPTDNLKNVIAGATQDEYEHEADQLVRLNTLTGDSYSAEAAKLYLDAYTSGELTFFEAKSEWGNDYTGVLPLLNTNGELVAALCVDVDVAEIQGRLRNNIVEGVTLIILLGLLFIGVFYIWTERKVSEPIELLVNSVADFASKCRAQKDPEALSMDVPIIRTNNEVQRLAEAVSKMSEAIREYVQNIATTENELARVTALANKDNLTGIRNINAFHSYTSKLATAMRNEEELSFALLIFDMNHLEKVNDSCGHEKGDEYIQKTCRVICEIFSHSPVFRISGDEFAVILTDQDYHDRNALISWARSSFQNLEQDESLPLWERCSAAIGVAEYHPGTDYSFDKIIARAMESMYCEKERMLHSK